MANGTTVQAGKRTTYPACKASGMEWVGEVPEHWDVRRLKYTATINDEALPETTDPDYEFTYVDIGSVDASRGIVATETYRFEDAPSRARRIVRDGDTIVSTVRTYLRAIAAIREPAENLIVSTGFAVVRPRSLDPGYLSYALRSPFFVETVVSRSTGVSYPAINAPEVSNFGIMLPPLDEQKTIAAFLDRETARIDALIEKKRRQIELLQEKRSALISHAVTKGLDPNAPMKDSGIEWLGQIPAHWNVRKVKHLTTKIGSGKTPRGGAEIYVDSGVMLFRSQNVHFDGLRLDDVVFIDDEVDAEMASTRVRPGDVLLNITGASLGRCCLVGEDIGPANVNQHVCIIRAQRSTVVPDYLSAAMSSFVAQSQIFASENGTSREGLNFQQVGNLLILVPPSLEEQDQISRDIRSQTRQIDAIISKVLWSIGQLHELRTAMISAAVTGKIDVRGGVAR